MIGSEVSQPLKSCGDNLRTGFLILMISVHSLPNLNLHNLISKALWTLKNTLDILILNVSAELALPVLWL